MIYIYFLYEYGLQGQILTYWSAVRSMDLIIDIQEHLLMAVEQLLPLSN